MDEQKYQAAVKKVQGMKTKDAYLLCKISWDTKILLPYKVGMVFMESLGQAERFEEEYPKPPSIQPMDRDRITLSVVSAKEYDQIRIAQLLQVPLDVIKEYETNNP